MKLIYVDDTSDNANYALIAAAIIPEKDFGTIERYLDFVVEDVVPEEQRAGFEFHASALFNGKPPFDKIEHEQVLGIFARCAGIVRNIGIPLFYGGVDLRALRASLYSTAQPLDVAFRSCLDGIQAWFIAQQKARKAGAPEEFGILICDDTSNTGLKRNLQETYRHWRGKAIGDFRVDCGMADCLHDDMYFGDSAHSVGIQIADMCAYITLRHLQGREDTEFLYQQILPAISYGVLHPEPEFRKPARERPRGDIESLKALIKRGDEPHDSQPEDVIDASGDSPKAAD